ncbi:hypothetical protein F0562_014007 [Nyssa sinensis]|uniref:MACPF domain-containing protein n=1 Tax=Nyssa sinensis TaxID=561372 RepID=A0A5J4ZRP3_9ASTE|nr:hypothetical protein F0562_014007 [Nyssa sinensis]
MAFNANRFDPQSAAEKAVSVIGFGYDLTADIRLSACKPGRSGSKLIELDRTLTKDLVVPGGVVVPNVSTAIKCDKGERTRFRSDVLSFNQMSEQFNQELSLSGKIPSGLFNAMFSFRGCWQKDAVVTKSLAFDGWIITLYDIELTRSQITLSEHVKQEVPSSWDAAALAQFIDKYGTHIVVGVKMGGKDVIHIKQLQNSTLQATEVQKLLMQLSDERFSEDVNGSFKPKSDKLSGKLKDGHTVVWNLPAPFANSIRPTVVPHSKNEDLLSIHIRRGGVDHGQSHNQWLSTVSNSPNVISMSFVPIVSLLSGVRGSGFLSHAINLYLRYKPPIEELHQFLEFQIPRQWAPLYVNTAKVDSGNRPVTWHPLILGSYEPVEEPAERGYFEPVKWSIFSHVCTAPVQYNGARIDDSASIVTKAWFEVRGVGMKKVLFLRLGFSTVASAKIRRSEWEGPTATSRKSGLMSMLISTTFSTGLTPTEKPAKVDLNSAVYPGGPPLPTRAPKLSLFVDTKEMVRGPEDQPGYWVVTGAKLCVEGGRIRIKVKYSLLTIMSEDSLLM